MNSCGVPSSSARDYYSIRNCCYNKSGAKPVFPAPTLAYVDLESNKNRRLQSIGDPAGPLAKVAGQVVVSRPCKLCARFRCVALSPPPPSVCVCVRAHDREPRQVAVGVSHPAHKNRNSLVVCWGLFCWGGHYHHHSLALSLVLSRSLRCFGASCCGCAICSCPTRRELVRLSYRREAGQARITLTLPCGAACGCLAFVRSPNIRTVIFCSTHTHTHAHTYTSSAGIMLNTGRIFCLVLLIAGCCALPANTNAQTKQDSSNNNNRTTELFAYPAEQSAIESKQNARNRTPIFIPKQCAENEILYPGDHENDWVCDCKPTYVYHPETQQCYQMYTRGYCPSGKIIYIEPKGKHPECVPNQCADGKVRFMNVCAVLNQEHQLCHLANIKLVVGIDEDTHELECVNISDVPFNRTLLSSQRESAGV